MEYYNKYIKKINKDYIVKKYNSLDEKIINNRGIHNDFVYCDNDGYIINIYKRSNEKIVGILHLDLKVKYGKWNDKVLYLFKPTNKLYPTFYIPYKTKNNHCKIFCIIEFKEWKITDKLPIGTLLDIIGIVGNKEDEIEHMRIYYNIKNNHWKIEKKKQEEDEKRINELQNKTEDYTVFSIDPEGSIDIDDAFHYKKIDNDNDKNSFEIGVHIASPTVFFRDEIYLKKIMERVSTVYIYNSIKKYNLLPTIYSENIISLLENKKRFALSVIFIVNDTLEIVSYEIKETIVKNKKQYTYDLFNQLNEQSNGKNFLNISKKIFKDECLDSHTLVEKWMILTNKTIANYLIKNKYENIIVRSHVENKNVDNIEKEKNISEELVLHLKFKKENSANYCLYDESNTNANTHSKMNNEYYTHFTSPIRRSIDFYIHTLLLNKNKIEKDELIEIINKINIFTKNCNKFKRITQKINFLYENKNKTLVTYGYIINISRNKLTIYIPEYNIEEKIIIIPYEFEKIFTVSFEYINETIIHKIIFVNDENSEKTFVLYQKINIELWFFVSETNIFDKLKIKIL
jgi:exoribonuclease R